jgi:hypothetical protein
MIIKYRCESRLLVLEKGSSSGYINCGISTLVWTRLRRKRPIESPTIVQYTGGRAYSQFLRDELERSRGQSLLQLGPLFELPPRKVVRYNLLAGREQNLLKYG